MKSVKLKCWVMIIIAATILGIAVSQCVMWWKPADTTEWIRWSIDVLCAVVAIVYISKYAQMLRIINKEE
jgi:predicted membrane channel-forming protein YqfA (hemolysin III family)